MSNLAKRVLVALVAVPLIILLALTGGYPFFLFVALVSAIALYEYYALARAKGVWPQAWLGITFGVLINAVFLHARLQYGLLAFLSDRGIAAPLPSMAQLFLILFLLFVPLVFLVELFRNRPGAMVNASTTIGGVAYVALFLGSLIGIRELFIPADFPVYQHFNVLGPSVPPDVETRIYMWGGLTIVTILAAIWLCDTAAYFAGRAFGKHKLFPRVSPNKTWEGAIAGFLAAVVVFVAGRALVLPYLSLGSAVTCGVIVGLFGQLGDLAESLLKRDAGVKDSSALIPGHGGVLDRFDSLMFVAPLLFFYLDFVVF